MFSSTTTYRSDSHLVNGCVNSYRYGFNGQEMDDEIFGSMGTSYDLGARMYNSRLGRMFSTDPWTEKYAWQSPYAYHRNSPIANIDWKGFGDPPAKEKKEIKKSFKKALEQRTQQDAERMFNSSVEQQYESDDVDLAKTKVDSKVEVDRGEDPWYTKIGGVHERKWEEKVKVASNSDEEATVEYFYLPGEDASYNVINKVEFHKNASVPFQGRIGSFILFKGKNKRTVGHILFTNQKEYANFTKAYQKNVKVTVLKLAKEYDTKNGTNTYTKWKKYYSNEGN
ncbi:MAG: hypothetical protein OQJ96_05995 [Flavobacteriales bacterium]|nr:hypothetical protein [Flavobacteriales bacterium]MCW8937629.1 hypothetical protein [Flavobacteriales bacterium]MCW8969374.1 hypothetical protein [Flavobacteriales bacterium]MCW8990117.1 hypothetical protein [Flavobacteriales bacterium]MCW9019835.1 hypothetical protein [Flavobacteriales bacterium]